MYENVLCLDIKLFQGKIVVDLIHLLLWRIKFLGITLELTYLCNRPIESIKFSWLVCTLIHRTTQAEYFMQLDTRLLKHEPLLASLVAHIWHINAQYSSTTAICSTILPLHKKWRRTFSIFSSQNQINHREIICFFFFHLENHNPVCLVQHELSELYYQLFLDIFLAILQYQTRMNRTTCTKNSSFFRKLTLSCN